MRKKDDRRKAQRESRAQRKAAEAAALEETVKRLKTHKRREVQERCVVCRCLAHGWSEHQSCGVAFAVLQSTMLGRVPLW